MTRTNPRQYVRIPMALLTTDSVKAATIATYAALASYADRVGFSFPSVPSIAKRAGLSEKVARRECDRLVKLGLLERRAHFDPSEGQRSNRYVLTWQRDDVEDKSLGAEQNRKGSGDDSATAPSSQNDGLTKSIINQKQQSTVAAEIVANAWSASGKLQRKEAVLRLITDALTNGIDREQLQKALEELNRTNRYVSAYSLSAAINSKPYLSLAADRKVDWSKESEQL